MNPLRALAAAVFRARCNSVCRAEYAAQAFHHVNERPVEYGFVFRCLLRCCPRCVLDIGTGSTALPQLMSHCGFVVTATDNVRDYWTKGMFNRHYHVIDDDITDTKLTQQFDFITCVSVLEHISDPGAAMRSIRKLLAPAGHLVLTFPYDERRYVENVYKLPGAHHGQDQSYVCRMFSRSELAGWTEAFELKIVEQEYWEVWSGDAWAFGERLCPSRPATKDGKHHLSCILLQAQ